jgi:sirohydrochlorin ferrochelatase
VNKWGILVISHGSRNEQWVQLVDDAVAELSLPSEMPITSAYLEIVEGRLIQDGIDLLEGQGVTDMVVVPLFISSGSTHIDEITYALGIKLKPLLETDLTPFRIQARVHLCDPIDDDPEIAHILYEKLQELSTEPEREIVLLVGHGSKEQGFHEQWRAGLESLAEQLKTLGGFAETDIAMLLPNQVDDRMTWWQEHKPDCTVIVAPLFLSEGYFTRNVIPDRFAAYPVRYNGLTLLPHPWIGRWMERQVRKYI